MLYDSRWGALGTGLLGPASAGGGGGSAVAAVFKLPHPSARCHPPHTFVWRSETRCHLSL